ncbi:MAG: hypothetical protein IKQ63_03775 [Eubacterium sp.]|nr:hypothetical protein [Eubacterium sp.]
MNTDNTTLKKKNARDIISITLNIVIVLFTVIGTCVMMTSSANGTGLTTSGLRNLKYFTVLSNEFCGIVALIWLIFRLNHKKLPVLLKFMAAAAVGLTFIIVAAFLAPMYPELNLYQGGNFWFHLIIPLTAMAEFITTRIEEPIPFRYTIISAILSLIYGFGYLVNILINGIGERPDTNDWYGFLNWGYPIGFVLFAFNVLMNWLMACLIRFLNKKVNQKIFKSM